MLVPCLTYIHIHTHMHTHAHVHTSFFAQAASLMLKCRGTQVLNLLRRKSLEKAIGGSSADCTFWREDGYTQPESLYDLSCSMADGAPFDFGCLRGKVVICVNVASL